ncbi:smoothelin, like isoform X1 [Nothobranchius furzeri]|uniref:Smoothelin, like n=1 Tax=Nothobranchius furzeri TaxID=105023 RepID=A0A8C6M747_NOTFU|nr:transcript variant X1 [Nothobranchius furzeri]
MEAPTLAQMEELCHPCPPSPEGETVCAALVRYENTLRDAIREIRADVSSFKLGVEHRLEETANLRAPLGRAVAQLQQENQQLRSQLEALAAQVELLSSISCDRSTFLNNHSNGLHNIQENQEDVKEVVHGKGQARTQTMGNQTQTYLSLSQSNRATVPSSPRSSSPPEGSCGTTAPGSSSSPSITRFSSRATFAVCSKTSSVERAEPIEVDTVPAHTAQENGHTTKGDFSVREQPVHGKITTPSDASPEQAAPAAPRLPHLPIMATTKTAESKRSNTSPSSPAGSLSPPEASTTGRSVCSSSHPQPSEVSAPQPASSLKTWSRTPASSPHLQAEKGNPTAVRSVTYFGTLQHDRDCDESTERPSGQMGERKRELVRSQTLPRNIGAQTNRAVFERHDSDTCGSRPKAVTLKRSQSFGVSNASSIKQILLEWCRSKTIGYQNIDIQNFSSSWSNGMAFCALVHSFFPTEFDYNSLSPANRKHNFDLAFGIAEKKAGCDRLIEVDDMMIMGQKPDPMCVFTYVQSLYNHLRKYE